MDKPVIPELLNANDDNDDDQLHAHTPTRIAAELRRLICKGSLDPGAKLSEEIIAAEFEVSRNTLREAFTILVGEDLVFKVPNRGVFVIDPGTRDIQEIYQARRFLEPSAILWGQLTPELTDTLQHVADQTRRGIAQENLEAIEEADRNFHIAAVALAGSTTMSLTLERLLTQLGLAFQSFNISPSVHESFAQQNLAIITRILAGERIDASRGLHRYLGLAENMVLQYVHPDGEIVTTKQAPIQEAVTNGHNLSPT
ncbi:MAG TPA: GntR family transcriptional regulator [Candidatus Yaniella excrementavium]|nr:GntR family transcriptional regulator [Candidatus Yaniella excrementavium]